MIFWATWEMQNLSPVSKFASFVLKGDGWINSMELKTGGRAQQFWEMEGNHNGNNSQFVCLNTRKENRRHMRRNSQNGSLSQLWHNEGSNRNVLTLQTHGFHFHYAPRMWLPPFKTKGQQAKKISLSLLVNNAILSQIVQICLSQQFRRKNKLLTFRGEIPAYTVVWS
jgi:hypothetical protein